jgi:hypothetical protein
MSQISAMQPQVEVTADTPPELAPIFSYLNSHSNKLYQEGYFLKLHDLDSRGRPSNARVWNECFAQLVGTVLSLWDAAALDAAGDEGEVMPTFINLSDASLKMVSSSICCLVDFATVVESGNEWCQLGRWRRGDQYEVLSKIAIRRARRGGRIPRTATMRRRRQYQCGMLTDVCRSSHYL